MFLRIAILALFLILKVQAQENAASSVSKSLLECYNKTENLNRDKRPPYSLNILIELIRKIESGPSMQNDRELSREIIHRFKQDGIVRFSSTSTSPYTVPFTPKGLQSYKHRLLLKQLVPGNAVNFPNNTLTEKERCTLHFMISNTVDLRQRGDESTTCRKWDQYVRRVRRDGGSPDDEVEIFDFANSSPLKGNLEENGEEPLEENMEESPVDTSVLQNQENARAVITISLSDCPVEDGVVNTKWGAIQAGTVLAGIAAGRQYQVIRTSENYEVDNRYAATLAGDLAEVGLHQGAKGKDQITVGAKGGWNGTEIPRWFFIEKNSDFQMTNAEIRGGLDGLIIAKNIEEWKRKVPSLRISQVLDMYYSPRGVFSKKYRACNRNALFTEIAPIEDLKTQTIGFSFLLEPNTELQGSIIKPEGIIKSAEESVDALRNYITNIINDLDCSVVENKVARVATDIQIVVDTQWTFSVAQRIISYLLDNLDINPFDSSYSVIGAKDGSVLVDSSRSLLQFYENYTSVVHLNSPTGFDATRVFTVIEERVQRKLTDEQSTKTGRGQSLIVLFLPFNVLDDASKNTANDRKEYLKNAIPDLKLLVLGRGSKDAYADLVTDSTVDSFGFTETSSVADSAKPVIARIQQVHRRIINPNCGSTSSGSNVFDQFVEPGGINYYRIASNYISGSSTLKLKGYGYGNLIGCISAQNSLPNSDNKDTDVQCQDVSTAETSFTVPSGGAVYFSVYAPPIEAGSTTFNCLEPECRFVDNVKYNINVDGLQCYQFGGGRDGGASIFGNIALLVTMFVLLTFRA